MIIIYQKVVRGIMEGDLELHPSVRRTVAGSLTVLCWCIVPF